MCATGIGMKADPVIAVLAARSLHVVYDPGSLGTTIPAHSPLQL